MNRPSLRAAARPREQLYQHPAALEQTLEVPGHPGAGVKTHNQCLNLTSSGDMIVGSFFNLPAFI